MGTIVAEPYAFEFPTRGLGLVVIDMQRDFLEPGGFGALLGNDVSLVHDAVLPTRRLLEHFREAGMPVFHTQEAHRPDLSDCPPSKRLRGRLSVGIGDPGPMGRVLVSGEPGNQIVPELTPLEGEVVIEKPGKGAFYATPFQQLLQEAGVTHLIVAGVTTEVCVQTTMREANDRGYECLLVEEATASYFPAFKQATLEMIRAQGGIVGWTARLDDVLAGLEA
ncbi:MAG TPA: cysteine hydrolase [bacterium]|nr:cysteine hydrolase [bacterium]